MEGQIATGRARVPAAHLICGSKLWTLAGLICCGYFAKVAITRVHGIWPWSHDPWDIATHLVWVLFMVGLITETRCRKERLFFGLILANFGFAFSMGLWSRAPLTLIHRTRVISATAWAIAALMSIWLMFSNNGRNSSNQQSG